MNPETSAWTSVCLSGHSTMPPSFSTIRRAPWVTFRSAADAKSVGCVASAPTVVLPKKARHSRLAANEPARIDADMGELLAHGETDARGRDFVPDVENTDKTVGGPPP